MKLLRNPLAIRVVARFGAVLIRAWMSTLRYRFHFTGPNVDPNNPALAGRYLYAFWHEYILHPAYNFGRPDIHVLISQHADGELIARICGHLGFNAVRGSTTRGGIEALRQMLRLGQRDHVAITPDGPRGPRRQVQQGLVYLAARTGLPVIPLGVGFRRAWRAGSWDRFAVPRPGTLATFVFGEPIFVPADADRDVVEHYRQLVEQEMLRLTEAAEHWAQSGEKPLAPPAAQSA